MSRKAADPNETYVVREMFGCEDGHCLPPGFTHWESGEGCPWGNHEGDPHLYWRNMLVPRWNGDDEASGDLWERISSQPNRWCHLPVAP